MKTPEPWVRRRIRCGRPISCVRVAEAISTTTTSASVFSVTEIAPSMKPSPPNLQELYLKSLAAIGIDSAVHDIRFVEDDWESPTLGAWGLGWEGWCDGMKVTASLTPPTEEIARDIESGESVAPKGEVNVDNQRARSPAERLALDDKSRAKSEKCLAEAIYFESRGEAVRGQMAVAQVVMNRVFSGKYPDTVCGVVYQNKYRHFACQFTFACDNNPDVIREPEMWDRAKKISKAMLDGQIWLPEVGKSTHYHAYWVRPSWVAEMKKMYKTGVHTFYRPRAWGDGSEEPSWGTPAQTAALSAELAQEAKSSAEMSASERR